MNLSVHVLLAAGVVLVGVGSDQLHARFASSHAPATLNPHHSSARTLHLRNSSWNEVRVEVRIGPYAACDSLESLGIQMLKQGHEWVVRFDDPVICWRRDKTPGDHASKWDAWQELTLADAEIRAVTL